MIKSAWTGFRSAVISYRRISHDYIQLFYFNKSSSQDCLDANHDFFSLKEQHGREEMKWMITVEVMFSCGR